MHNHQNNNNNNNLKPKICLCAYMFFYVEDCPSSGNEVGSDNKQNVCRALQEKSRGSRKLRSEAK